MDLDAVDSLADSIREYGVIEPVVVKQEGEAFILLAGERRVMAARKAGLASVPAILRDGTSEEMLSVALIENIQREDLNPIDEALAFRRLQDEFGLIQEEIAKRVGRSRVAIANAVRLLQLPPDILNDVSRGTLSPGHARALLSVEDAEIRSRLWRKIKERNLSVRAAEDAARQLVGARRRRRQPSATPTRDPQISFLEDRLRHHLGTQVRIAPQRGGGKIEIEYYGEDDLQRLLELFGVAETV